MGGPQARSSSAGLDTSRRSPAPNLPARNCPVPFCGVGLVAAKMNSQRIHLRKIFPHERLVHDHRHRRFFRGALRQRRAFSRMRKSGFLRFLQVCSRYFPFLRLVFAVFEAQEFRLPTARAFDFSSRGGSEAGPPERHSNRGCPLVAVFDEWAPRTTASTDNS